MEKIEVLEELRAFQDQRKKIYIYIYISYQKLPSRTINTH